MSTGELQSVIADEAMSVLACFQDGLDNVVYSLAETFAVERCKDFEIVEITVADVKKAGDLLFGAYAKIAKENGVSKQATEQMKVCFDIKTGGCK